LHAVDVERVLANAAMAAGSVAEEAQDGEDGREVPDWGSDLIMRPIMPHPVRMRTSGIAMDRDAWRNFLSDK
jgi:hypothetical protein